jgi:hypothetical protein
MLRKLARLLLDPKPPEGGNGTPEATPPADQPTPLAEGNDNPDEPGGDEPAPEPEPPKEGKDDPLLKSLGIWDNLNKKDEVPKIEPAPEPDAGGNAPPTETPQVTPPTTQPSAPPADSEKGKRKKKGSVVKVDLDVPPAPPAHPVPPAPVTTPTPATPPDPDAEYINSLTDEQKEELLEAEVAERLYPEKYKDRKKKLVAWYRKLDDTANSLLTADPNRKLDEKDEEFKNFLDTKPPILSAHVKSVQRTIGKEEATKEVRQQIDPELKSLKRKQDEIEIQPYVERVTTQFEVGVQELISGDEQSPLAEASKLAREKGMAASEAAFPMESRIYKEEMSKAKKMIQEYVKFAKEVGEFNPKNETHTDLLQFINEEGQSFAANGGELLIQNGKRFLPRADYITQLHTDPDGTKQKYWTFSHEDIINMLAWKAKSKIESRVKAEDNARKRDGYERRPKASSSEPPKPATTPAPPEPTPITPPKATPSRGRVPGGPTSTPPAPGDAKPIDVASVLGMKKAGS